jgi:hypothetical protein
VRASERFVGAFVSDDGDVLIVLGGQQDQEPRSAATNPGTGWPAAGRPEARTAGAAEVIVITI